MIFSELLWLLEHTPIIWFIEENSNFSSFGKYSFPSLLQFCIIYISDLLHLRLFFYNILISWFPTIISWVFQFCIHDVYFRFLIVLYEPALKIWSQMLFTDKQSSEIAVLSHAPSVKFFWDIWLFVNFQLISAIFFIIRLFPRERSFLIFLKIWLKKYVHIWYGPWKIREIYQLKMV